MSRTRKLVSSGLIIVMLALHLAISWYAVSSVSGLAMVSIGVSVLVMAGALGVFLKACFAEPDGLSFFAGDDDAQRRSRRVVAALLPLTLLATILVAVGTRFLGVPSSGVSSFGDSLAAVLFPFIGSVVLIGMLRKGSTPKSDRAG